MRRNSLLRVAFVAVLAVFSVIAAPAQTTTVHTFESSGNILSANFVQAPDGALFGVTRQGGANGAGSIFWIRPDGTGYQVVYSFASGASSPRFPGFSLVLGPDGVLYGVTEFGAAGTFGALYKVNTDGSGFTVLRAFTAGPSTLVNDAGVPRGGLVFASDGFLYGLATRGSATTTPAADNSGVLYRIRPDGTAFSIIFSFDTKFPNLSGSEPSTLIQGRDGVLYGTFRLTSPGATGGVFSVRTDGSAFTQLRQFSRTASANGFAPGTPLVHAADGLIYGTTVGGGSRNAGTIFRMRPDGTALEIVYSFVSANASDGYGPTDVFFQGRDGSLYGRTSSGGAFINGDGDIYKIRPDGTGRRRLHSFDLGQGNPVAFQGLDGSLYTAGQVEVSRTTVGNTTQIRFADSIVRIIEEPGPEITAQPRSQTIAPGGSVGFSVTAPGATSYQWQRDNAAIPGATSATYTLSNLTAAANATYSVVVGNATGSTTSTGAVLLVAPPVPGRLINLSVRTTAGTGAQTLIAGFYISGTFGTSKQVLVRAIGPSLTQFGVAGALADPQLGLFRGSTQVATNNGWGGSAPLSTAFAQVGAFPLTATTRDAALLTTVPQTAYTAQVSSTSGGTGVALVEVYDADPSSSSSAITNLSARTLAGTGAQTLIAGFVLSGNVPKTFVIRGIGPGLAQFGVTGTIANPRLELHTTINNQDVIVAANAGWGGANALSAAFAQVAAFPLPPTSTDAALLVSLAPGTYTAQVTGVNNTTGVALVEIYEVP